MNNQKTALSYSQLIKIIYSLNELIDIKNSKTSSLISGDLKSENNDILESLNQAPVNTVNFSVRVRQVLQVAKIDTIGQLVNKTYSQMLLYRQFGKKSLQEVEFLLKNHGLKLRGENPFGSYRSMK